MPNPTSCLVNADCQDDDLCNGQETCEAGACVPGQPVVCDDGDACTGEELCDSATGVCLAGEDPCLSTAALDACEPTDTEAGYVCRPVDCLADADCEESAPYCDDNNECVACLTNADCDDGLFCNGPEVCNNDHECTAGVPVDCDDGDACTGTETCDDTLGACVAGEDPCSLTEALDRCEPATTEEGYVCEVVECLVDEDCDDGVGCNGVETCSAQNTCVPGTNPCEVTAEVDVCNERDAAPFYECLPVGCLSNNDCTDPSAPYCNAGNECVACLEHAHCDDSNACNGVETCSSQQTCTPGTDPCLDTAAIDVCVSVSTEPGYECQEVECLENDHCLDEDLCNGAESCSSDNECISGTPVTCDDGDACNGLETCVASTGACASGETPCSEDETCVPESSDNDYSCSASGLLDVVAGGDKSCAITLTGDLYCWGSNIDGEISTGAPAVLAGPELVSSEVQGVGLGRLFGGESGSHLCYIHETNAETAVVCSGAQYFGMLGDGMVLDLLTPANQAEATISMGAFSGSGLTAIDAGLAHTCVGTDDGKVFCWGMSYNGQTGTWVDPFLSNGAQATPAPVAGLPDGKQVIDLGTGAYHSCAVLAAEDEEAGDLYCWGSNQNGQLGVPSPGELNCLDIENLEEVPCTTTPKKVTFPGAVAGVSNVCGGNDYTCAITEPDGTLYCWGDYTQLGISNSLVSPAGSTVSMDVVDVACGLYHVCALTADGRVNCFGEDNYGEGQSTLTLSEAFPTQVAVGADHTCVAGAVPNSVYCWGGNASGQLGTCLAGPPQGTPQEVPLLGACSSP